MAALPYDRTPSGAAAMTLSPVDVADGRLLSLIDSYFEMGGLHLHFTLVDADLLREAVREPERHQDLMVRVAGFSAYFVRLAPYVQQDVIRRCLR